MGAGARMDSCLRRNDGRVEAAGFHGNDEHMSIENLKMGVELTYEIVRRMVT